MTSRRDILEAQQFDKRRLVSAFIAGAPPEQAAPSIGPARAIAAGITIAILIVAGSAAHAVIGHASGPGSGPAHQRVSPAGAPGLQ